ncbi:MAG: UbiA-like polyprenyltransferase [Phycisphaerales bacterium]
MTTAAAHPSRSLPTPKELAHALGDIKLAHSVFALPFAVLAAALAVPAGTSAGTVSGLVGLVVVCMVLARTWAMLVNRLADHAIDAANPRTARRAVASGRVRVRAGWAIALGCAALFVGACSLFFVFFGNPWPVMLSVPVLGWIALYSYTKRFTALCHVFLGSALAISPVAAVIAVNPDALLSPEIGGAVACLAGFVLLWVAGFDVAYALQDLDFDRSTDLHSIPAKLGASGALWVSRAMHTMAFAGLVGAQLLSPALGLFFWLALVVVFAALLIEHAVLARQGVKGLPIAFFTMNGVISVAIAALGIADILT